jgi:Fe-S-cluster containining protein
MIVPPFVLSGGRNEAAEKGVPPDWLQDLLPLWQLRLQLPEAPCVWFDPATARCRHYDLRPDACRAFEINSGPCHASRAKWNVGALAGE